MEDAAAEAATLDLGVLQVLGTKDNSQFVVN